MLVNGFFGEIKPFFMSMSKYLLRFVFLTILLSSAIAALSQRVSRYEVGVGGLISSGKQIPFWLRANQYGTVPLRGSAVRVEGAFHTDYRPVDSIGYRPKFDWGYGFSAVISAGATETRPDVPGSTGTFLLPEAYVKARFGAFEAYVGRRKEMFGLVDTLLTTGAYAWSGNALPIPKLQVSLPTYTALPFTKGVISVLGGAAHGWFESSDKIVTGSYLHQSWLYGRLGKPSWRFRLYGGFNHEAVWGGETIPGNPSVPRDGKLPSSLKFLPNVALGIRGIAIDPKFNSPNNFEGNRIGNHLGSIDLAADVSIGSWNVFGYRQLLFETGSLFYLTSIVDGINGLRLRNERASAGEVFFLKQLTFEYIFTGSQGGDEFVLDDPQRRGRVDYFNNAQFNDGWRYFGRTIGNPLLTANGETDPSLPQRAAIANNRVSAFHMGLTGQLLSTVDLTAKLTLSRNAGTYVVPYLTIPTQFSGLLMAAVPLDLLGGIVLNGSLAVDMGGLLPSSVGAYLGLRKTGVLRRNKKSTSTPAMRF